MGVRNSAHSLSKLLNPFRDEAVLVAPATHPDFIELMGKLLIERLTELLFFYVIREVACRDDVAAGLALQGVVADGGGGGDCRTFCRRTPAGLRLQR